MSRKIRGFKPNFKCSSESLSCCFRISSKWVAARLLHRLASQRGDCKYLRSSKPPPLFPKLLTRYRSTFGLVAGWSQERRGIRVTEGGGDLDTVLSGVSSMLITGLWRRLAIEGKEEA